MEFSIPLPLSDDLIASDGRNSDALSLSKVEFLETHVPVVDSNSSLRFLIHPSPGADNIEFCALQAARGRHLIGTFVCSEAQYTFSRTLFQSKACVFGLQQALREADAEGVWMLLDSKRNPYFDAFYFLMKEAISTKELCNNFTGRSEELDNLTLLYSDRKHVEYLKERFEH